jgi:putative ATP-dependent endonuclease of the OLD family
MKLVSLTLRNFRCFKDAKTISFENLTAIIGRNDGGKSTILEALEIFFNNDTVKIDVGGLCVSATDDFAEITCDFCDLPDSLVLDAQAETSLANEYMLTGDGTLRVTKRFRCSGAKPKEEVFICALHPSADQYGDLLELTNAALKARLRELGIDETNVHLNSNPSIRGAIWNHCPDLELTETEIPIAKEDGKRIWDKLSEHMPLFALFQSDRASRDSDAEVQNPMKLAIATALADPAIQQSLDEIVEAVRAQAVELAQRTHAALAKIDPGLAGDLSPQFRSDPKWAGLFTITLDSEQGIPVNKRGSGVRRLILVSFFRAEAERRLNEGVERNIIYAIEEPETSQHPHNQKMLLESLEDLASEPGCQVVLTTHSPGFASYLPISSFRFVHAGANDQPVVEPAQAGTWKALVDTLGVVPDNRVKVLICVEGPTDVAALSALGNALHSADSTIPDISGDPRIAFVVLGGGTLVHWVNEHYLKDLGRPEVHVYDSDATKYATQAAQINQRTDGSWAARTLKYEIENYLHPDAIQEGLGVTVAFGDNDDVPNLITAQKGWNANTVKKKLARLAFPRMTADRLQARDPNGEVEGWLRRIEAML